MLYSRSLFSIYFMYNSVYVNPNLPVYPRPTSSPLATIIFFLHLWLCICFVNKFICTIFLDSIYHTNLSFSVWLHWAWRSLGPSLLLQTALFHSFYDWVILHLYMCGIFFIHLSVHGHLCCFHVLAIVNSAAMNIGCVCVLSNYDFLQVCAKEWDYCIWWLRQ